MNIESPLLNLFTKLQAVHYFNIKTALIVNGLAAIIINRSQNHSAVINRPKYLPVSILNML
jgi:hypothetical protein